MPSSSRTSPKWTLRLSLFPALCTLATLGSAQLPWGAHDTDRMIQANAVDIHDHFGASLDVSGSYAAIGATGDDDAAANAGTVVVLERNLGGANAWGEARKLFANDPAVNDALGRAVGIGGTLVVAGAKKSIAFPTHDGAAYLFDATTGAQIAKVFDTDPFVVHFGTAVATDGVNVVVGANHHTGTQFNKRNLGRAYVYDASGNFRFTLVGSDTDYDDYFGTEVAAEGAYIAASAASKENGGTVYVFDATTGAELHRLTGSGVNPGWSFGHRIDISGDKLIAAGSGGAWVFDLTTGAELWRFQGEGYNLPGFGNTVAIDGDWAYVGAPGVLGGKFGRIYQICLSSGLMVTGHQSCNGEALGQSDLAADGGTVFSGDNVYYTTTFGYEGAVSVMTRKDFGLGIDVTVQVVPDPFELTLRGGDPGRVGGLAVTSLNGTPVAPSIFHLGIFSASGEIAPPPFVSLPSMVGLTVGMTGGGFAKSGWLTISNSVEGSFL